MVTKLYPHHEKFMWSVRKSLLFNELDDLPKHMHCIQLYSASSLCFFLSITTLVFLNFQFMSDFIPSESEMFVSVEIFF